MIAGVSGVRWLLGAVGVGVGLYGAWLLLDRQDTDQLVSAATWVVAGVVLHDFVLVVLVMVLHALTVRRLPLPWRAPVTVGAVVLGSVTLLAVPVLGRFGAKPDNPTLLDRDYGTGWLVFAAVVVVAVVVAGVRRSRRAGASGATDSRTDTHTDTELDAAPGREA